MHQLISTRNNVFLSILLVSVLFISCSETNEEVLYENAMVTAQSRTMNVYVSGIGRGIEERGFPTYWRNGSAVMLSGSFQDALVYGGAAFDMTVSKKDVYVRGVLHTSKGNIPTYWKNGTPTYLPGPVGQAVAIADTRTGILACGIVSFGDGYSHAAVWKNGAISYLAELATSSSASTVAVSGSDVYIGGYLMQDGKTYAAYWKNGNPVLLSSGENYAYVTSLAISGSDVYAAGRESSSGGKYWKNGEAVVLSDEPGQVEITQVFVDRDNVYAAGKKWAGTHWEMVVWKNEQIQSATPAAGFELEVTGLVVDRDDIYVSGVDVFKDETSTTFANAVLWKNGVPQILDNGLDVQKNYGATSVVLAKK